MSSDSVDLTHTVVLKAGNAFLVSEPDGDMPLDGDHALGVYRDDGRFLLGHELRVARRAPSAARGLRADRRASVHELTNPDLELPGGRRLAAADAPDPRSTGGCSTTRRCEERIHVHLYGREPVELDVELALAADFRPMLALRGMARTAGAGGARSTAADGGVRFSARGGDGVAAHHHGHRGSGARRARRRAAALHAGAEPGRGARRDR